MPIYTSRVFGSHVAGESQAASEVHEPYADNDRELDKGTTAMV